MGARKFIAMILTAAMVLSLVSAFSLTVSADIGIVTKDGIGDIIVLGTASDTPTKVGFGGKLWDVIGYNGDGVTSASDTMTLLLASWQGSGIEGGDFVYYDTEGSNQYSTSNLKSAIETRIPYYIPTQRERDLINPRDFEGGAQFGDNSPNVAGAPVTNALLWPLSVSEANQLHSNTARVFSNTNWWLRSPGDYGFRAVFVDSGGTFPVFGGNVNSFACAVRPAFNLNLSSVIFASAAAGGKSTATIGSDLMTAQSAAQNLKFTVLDSGITAPTLIFAETTNGSTDLRFGYSGAETGTNQYVSCVLEQSGAVKYYGKLADCATIGSGTLSVPLSGVTEGNYTLKIFSEQANGDYCTDFCSNPVTMTVTVSSGNGTVSGFGGATDNTRPGVSSVSPNVTDVAITTNTLSVAFSEAMNTTITSGVPVGTINLSPSGTPLTFTNWTNSDTTANYSLSGLAYNTTYTYSISGFQDATGNTMTADNTKTFTTARGVLGQVTGATLSVTGQATWTDLPDETGLANYSVQLYKNGSPLGSPKTSEAGTGTTGVNFLSEIRTAGADTYTVMVTAIGNGTTHNDGTQSDASAAQSMSKLSAPGNPAWSGTNATFDKLADETNVEKYSITINGTGTVNSSSTADVSKTGSNLSVAVTGLAAGDTFTVKAIALTTGLFLDSDASLASAGYAIPNSAPTVKSGEGTQTGIATPASNDGTTAAVPYTADVAAWFEDTDGDTLTYAIVSEDADGIVDLTAGTLTFTPSIDDAENDVEIIVKANDGTADSTGNVTITITVGAAPADTPPNTLPSFTQNPSNQTVTEGNNAAFTVAASGNPAPTYQWQENSGSGWNNINNGGVYSGATTVTLTLTGVTLSMNDYQYRCSASNSEGTAASATAALTVNALPVKTVLVGTQNGTLTAGTAGSATFAVTTENITSGSAIMLNNVNNITGIALVTTNTTGDSTTLTIGTTAATPHGSHPLTLTIDGITSGVFYIVVGTPAQTDHTVTFINDGVIYTTRTAASGSALGINWPSNPGKTDYYFDGWFAGGVQYDEHTPITGDITLTAHWSYTGGNNNNNSGSSYTPPAVVYGTAVFYGQSIGYSLASGVLTVNISAHELRNIVDNTFANTDGSKTVKLSWNSVSGMTGLNLAFNASLLKADEAVTFIAETPFGVFIFNTPQMLDWFGGDAFGTYTITLEKSSLKADVKKNGRSVVWNKLTPMARIGVPYTIRSGETAANIAMIDRNGRVLPTSVYEKGMVYADIYTLGTYRAGAATPVTFNDTAGHWAKTDIDFVTVRRLMSGITDTAYAPNTAITRAEYLMALGKLSGADVSGYRSSRFTDVSDWSVYMPYIEWAAVKGIVVGVGDNKFAPDSTITREEMAQMMLNYAKTLGYVLPENNSATAYADDTDISFWAADAVTSMQKSSVMTGKDGNRFDPRGNTTRGEAATILRRFVENVISSR